MQIEQVVAANIDYVLLVSGLDRNYNPARIQRFLVATRESGAEPVIVLNKSDVIEDGERVATELQKLVPGVRILLTSTIRDEGLTPLHELAQKGVTIALIGSSGVGKSTLANALTNDDFLPTAEVRAKDSKGRHTTTARELILLDDGGILIDNPGMREIQMWTDEHTLRESFLDVEQLASECKFHDCKHRNDTGCAIRAAVESGQLDEGRYEGYLKLDEEIDKLQQRQKKRRIIAERRAKRDHRIKARNLADRVDQDKDQEPDWR